VVRNKKDGTKPIIRAPKWEGRDKQTNIEHALTCYSVTKLSLIALLSTGGRIFKHRRVSFHGRKMLDCKGEQRVNSRFLVKLKKSATETFQLWNLDRYVWSGNQATINAVEINIISKTKNARISRSKFKAMFIVFFYIQGIVMAEWVPSGQTVN